MQKYRLLRKVGEGTFGEVYLAQDTDTSQTVAVKILKKKTNSLQTSLKLREVQALLHLSHPNIMQLTGLLHRNNQLWMVCEYGQSNLYNEFIRYGLPPS